MIDDYQDDIFANMYWLILTQFSKLPINCTKKIPCVSKKKQKLSLNFLDKQLLYEHIKTACFTTLNFLM